MPFTFREFFAELDQHPDRVPLDELVRLVGKLTFDREALRPYAVFDPTRYRRNLIQAGPGYQALLLCWRAGQRSPIHDHKGSSCAVRVIEGTLTETIFDRTADGYIYPTHTHKLEEGGVCGSEDTDIHQISNLEPGGKDLLTLHVYTPALDMMGVYSLTDTQIRRERDPVFEFSLGSGI